MKLDDIETLARYIANSDGLTTDTPDHRLALGDRIKLAKAMLLVLPVVRAAMESTDNIPQCNRPERLGDAWRHRIADAVDTMRAALANDPPADVERRMREQL